MAMSFLTLLALLGIPTIILWMFVIWYFFGKRIKRFFLRNTRKDSYIEVHIIQPNNQIYNIPTTYGVDNTVTVGKEKYIVDLKCIRYTGFWGNVPNIYYISGIPNPIDFTETYNKHKNSKEAQAQIDSRNYNTALTQKFLNDLMQQSLEAKIILLVLIIIGIVLIAIALKVYGFVEYEYTPEGQ